jgi:hypothetical protein
MTGKLVTSYKIEKIMQGEDSSETAGALEMVTKTGALLRLCSSASLATTTLGERDTGREKSGT